VLGEPHDQMRPRQVIIPTCGRTRVSGDRSLGLTVSKIDKAADRNNVPDLQDIAVGGQPHHQARAGLWENREQRNTESKNVFDCLAPQNNVFWPLRLPRASGFSLVSWILIGLVEPAGLEAILHSWLHGI